MAASSLLALIDDIATILDDVAVMTKVAAKKTTGVLSDDLALNANQVAGVRAEREIPVVWAVAKGSAINKVILVPAALVISVIAPWIVTPLLMLGGTYLCYEGFEKLAHKFLHSAEEDSAHEQALAEVLIDPDADMVEFEREKIKGAIRTDFILSAEIIVIAMGTIKEASFLNQALTLVVVAVLMTVGVYGLVAGIVKLDDAGMYLLKREGRGALVAVQQRIGRALLLFAPMLMKALSVIGTAAMFLVGGGILVRGIGPLHHGVESLSQAVGGTSVAASALAGSTATLANALIGIVAGAICVSVVSVVSRIRAN